MAELPIKTANKEGQIVYSKSIKAGKRIYYLDVRKNRREELFLTITESRKIIEEDGNNQISKYEKHKIFLYKEDFFCFLDGLQDAVEYIEKNNTVNFVPEYKKSEKNQSNTEIKEETDFNFDL